MELFGHFVMFTALAAGAGGAATAYASAKQPRWVGFAVFLGLVALVWGFHAVLATNLDDIEQQLNLIDWRLDVLDWRTGP